MNARALNLSPFGNDRPWPRVHIASGRGAYENTRAVLTGMDLGGIHGLRILLKPNAGRIAAPGSGITTHPDVVAAAIDAFREAGAHVSVGESPITGVRALKAFEATGIAAVARERNCPLLDLDARAPVEIAVEGGIAIKSLQVCRDVLEHDAIVSIPVMKTHMHTGVTLAVKNMKGCLWRRSKVDLHMLPRIEGRDERPLDIAIADMSTVLRPHLSIVDGAVGMEGLGPSAGTAKPMDIVLAGLDAFAVDAVACSLMGFRAHDVPHLRMGAERGRGVIDLAKIQVDADSWPGFVSPFQRPPENLSFLFPGIVILDDQSCSACQSTLLMFLTQHAERIFDYFPGRKDVAIAIGKGHTSLPEDALCIGNCTDRHKEGRLFVPGCPPVASQILRKISGDPKEE